MSETDDDPPKPEESPSPPPDAASPPADYEPVDPGTGLPYTPAPLVDSDEPVLPAALGDHALSEAVGVRKSATPPPDVVERDRFDDDDEHEADRDERRWSRKTIVVASISIMAGLSIAALVFLGHANAQRYTIVCSASRVTAEQGRGFPPWGTHAMTAPEWKPITLPPNAECKPRETEELDELGKWYLDLLVERASATLTARNPLDAGTGSGASPLDIVSEELDQALLLARNPDRRDQRKDVERLKGDVEYWRASARLREASSVLAEAAKQFDTAAAQRPRHVTDAAAWGAFLKRVADELHAGPNGAPTQQFPTAPGPATPTTAPAGVALPVEPDKGSDSGSAAAPPPAPDAGVPSGGVLL